ncbi:MAG: tRNA glutamyl-Q(34) synthetase GluQRS [Muribaculaceae bacterium]|nr:tRNA glutamyl-Q(34) synthetase GluQRS [Muribaculaceae bacterium]
MKGRFAPSPTGRMHLGNLFTALLSWLSVRKNGGKWILRIEDLDPQRSKREYSKLIEDDLAWLGLDWDEGGLAGCGECGPYEQSMRSGLYLQALERVASLGLVYPCTCTHHDLLATQAPHSSDGRVIYTGRCRPTLIPYADSVQSLSLRAASRLYVPDRTYSFVDKVYGKQHMNLATECGDFILRRADGAWAYQLAVVVDDALMGVTEIVRGADLLPSTAQQLYLYSLLGYAAPDFAHVPLVCNSAGVRLSKRDKSLDMESLRSRYSQRDIIGILAYIAGLTSAVVPCTPAELINVFSWDKIPALNSVNVPVNLYEIL